MDGYDAEEMTCAVQATEIIGERVQPGVTFLDVGYGGGYYYHQFNRLDIDVGYYGLDYTTAMIVIARHEMAQRTSLPPSRFTLVQSRA